MWRSSAAAAAVMRRRGRRRRAGLKTVVIEGGKEVGGLCILRGCMPTKALLYAAEVKHLAEHAETWGVRAGKVSFDFAKVMARKNAYDQRFRRFPRPAAQRRKIQIHPGQRKISGRAHGGIEQRSNNSRQTISSSPPAPALRRLPCPLLMRSAASRATTRLR